MDVFQVVKALKVQKCITYILRMYVNFIIFHINSCFFKYNIVLFKCSCYVFITMRFLDRGHYSAMAGPGQPDARAAIVIKFCSKASLLPTQGKKFTVN